MSDNFEHRKVLQHQSDAMSENETESPGEIVFEELTGSKQDEQQELGNEQQEDKQELLRQGLEKDLDHVWHTIERFNPRERMHEIKQRGTELSEFFYHKFGGQFRDTALFSEGANQFVDIAQTSYDRIKQKIQGVGDLITNKEAFSPDKFDGLGRELDSLFQDVNEFKQESSSFFEQQFGDFLHGEAMRSRERAHQTGDYELDDAAMKMSILSEQMKKYIDEDVQFIGNTVEDFANRSGNGLRLFMSE